MKHIKLYEQIAYSKLLDVSPDVIQGLKTKEDVLNFLSRYKDPRDFVTATQMINLKVKELNLHNNVDFLTKMTTLMPKGSLEINDEIFDEIDKIKKLELESDPNYHRNLLSNTTRKEIEKHILMAANARTLTLEGLENLKGFIDSMIRDGRYSKEGEPSPSDLYKIFGRKKQ